MAEEDPGPEIERGVWIGAVSGEAGWTFRAAQITAHFSGTPALAAVRERCRHKNANRANSSIAIAPNHVRS